MRKNAFCVQRLILLLATGTWGCGREPIERVPDQTVTHKHAAHPAGKEEVPSLGTQWDEHLGLLEQAKQREKFQKSILKLREDARKKMLRMVGTVPADTPRKEFLEDMASFASEALKSLLNILLYLYDRKPGLMSEIFAKLGEVNFWKQLQFYKLEKELPRHDQDLLNRLIAELKIPNN